MEGSSKGRPCRRFVEKIYREAWAYLVARFRLRGLSNDDAEDKAQDLFVSMLEGRIELSSSDEEVRLRQLSRISKHITIDHFRTGARRRRLLAEAQFTKSEEVASPSCCALETDELLERIAPEQREAVVRYVIWGQTAHEIGASMGISPNTVSSRLRRALEALSWLVAAVLAMLANLHELLRWRRARPTRAPLRCSLAAGALAVLVLGLATAPPPTIELTKPEIEGGTFGELGEAIRRLTVPPPKAPERKEEIQVVHHSAPPRARAKTPVSSVPVPVPTPSNPERELIDRAYLHLRSDPGRAAAALDKHEDAFPKGHLVAERNALRQTLAEAKAEKQRVDD